MIPILINNIQVTDMKYLQQCHLLTTIIPSFT